jgi:hypothetical protein
MSVGVAFTFGSDLDVNPHLYIRLQLQTAWFCVIGNLIFYIYTRSLLNLY